MNYIRSTGAIALGLVLTAFVTCKSEERAPQLSGDRTNTPMGGTAGRGGSSSDEPDASVAAGAGGTEGGGIVNCGEVICRGAGKCMLDEEGEPTCVCDDGYTLAMSGECVVDEECIKLRAIEEGCRQRTGSEPAIALAFNMETCAGTTVRPDVIGDITRAFKVLEDDNDIGDESYATVFDRDVESWVVIAIDMSSSVVGSGALADVISSLRDMVASLAPAEGEPPVRIQIMPFARSVSVAREFTEDLGTVDATLQYLGDYPELAVAEPDGTNLNGVINAGVGFLETVLAGRVETTGGAVVATGTLVTITDGRDTGGVRLEAIPDRINVISVGISSNINDAELTRIGPQGSFLAPTSADRDVAFATVAQRVKDYPQRAYLLAYCSPAVAGTHAVQATLANLDARLSATCEFNAMKFGTGSPCNQNFIQSYCSEVSHGCGKFLACDPACTGLNPYADAGVISDDWEFSD
jgi:von Willebrand factor type A domain